jgi:hypothetical protein
MNLSPNVTPNTGFSARNNPRFYLKLILAFPCFRGYFLKIEIIPCVLLLSLGNILNMVFRKQLELQHSCVLYPMHSTVNTTYRNAKDVDKN